VLRPLQNRFDPRHYPDLLVGLGDGDDAAVYRISQDVAVIQTLDFFTPIVDDPYDFGAIAAANALSDVYAMGGEAVLALNVCGFPDGLPQGVIAEILRGGADKVAEAGAVLVGLLESFSSFWASAFKEVIVFTLIIPVLLWRSLTTRHVEEEE